MKLEERIEALPIAYTMKHSKDQIERKAVWLDDVRALLAAQPSGQQATPPIESVLASKDKEIAYWSEQYRVLLAQKRDTLAELAKVQNQLIEANAFITAHNLNASEQPQPAGGRGVDERAAFDLSSLPLAFERECSDGVLKAVWLDDVQALLGHINSHTAALATPSAPVEAGRAVAWTSFEDWAKANLGQGYSMESEEGVYTDPVTRWAFNGFSAGMRTTPPSQAGSGQAVDDIAILNLMIEDGIAYRDDRRPDRVLMFPLNSSEIKDCIKKAIAKFSAPLPQAGEEARDAARYRWLRNPDTDVALVLDKRTGWVPSDENVHGVGGYHTYEYRAGDDLDAAIDAAMAQRASEKGGGVMAQARGTMKFKIVLSDSSSLDGTMRCTDEQWNAIFAILVKTVPPSLVNDAVERAKESERAA